MLKPRTPFLVTLLAGVIGAIVAKVVGAAVKAIFDVTVQDFWKETIAPYLSIQAGPWSTTMLGAIGPYWAGFGSAFLFMYLIEMVLAWHRKRHAESTAAPAPQVPVVKAAAASRALLRLRFSGRLEAPEEIAKENVQSWFTYWSPGARAEDQNGNALFEVPSSWAVFLTFEHPVAYRQLAAQFTGARPTSWQVRQTLPTVAVLTVDGGMPECELEIITRS